MNKFLKLSSSALLAVALLAAIPSVAAAAPGKVSKSKTQLVSCEVQYTLPPSTKVRSLNIQQSTHYQFGYDERGYLWHRVYWDGAYVTNPVTAIPAKRLVGLWADVYVESVTGPAGVKGLWYTYVDMSLYTSTFQFGPSAISRWEPVHRQIRVRNRNVLSVAGAQFLPKYRMDPDVYGNKYGEPNYGMCTTNTWSPYTG